MCYVAGNVLAREVEMAPPPRRDGLVGLACGVAVWGLGRALFFGALLCGMQVMVLLIEWAREG